MAETAKLNPPPNKKRRIDNTKRPYLATVFPKDIVIYILSFLEYQKGIILLLKTCKFFNEFINNNPSCIKHYGFGKYEWNIDKNKLFKKMQSIQMNQNTNNNSNIITFLRQFSKLESLEMMTIDPTLFRLLNVELNETVFKLYVQNMLKPLQNKLVNLNVTTWDDAALGCNSFNFDNIQFTNVTHLRINGKDVRYPFHITDYTPNIETLTMIGVHVLPYSLFRVLFDTQKSIKNLLQFSVHNLDICPSNSLYFYETKFDKIINVLKVYDISELSVNQNGGQLQLIDFMWGHGDSSYRIRNFVLFMILFNRLTLQSLRINFEIFYAQINIKEYDMERWNGMTQFMAKRKIEKRIHLPKLEHLLLSINRVSAKDYQRVDYNLLFYKLDVPKLHSIELIPGVMCWHNNNGFIPFLIALIGDQFYKLKRIKIIYKHKIDKTQQEYLQSSIHTIRRMFQRKKQSIHIEY